MNSDFDVFTLAPAWLSAELAKSNQAFHANAPAEFLP